jgi:hypothetical protein
LSAFKPDKGCAKLQLAATLLQAVRSSAVPTGSAGADMLLPWLLELCIFVDSFSQADAVTGMAAVLHPSSVSCACLIRRFSGGWTLRTQAEEASQVSMSLMVDGEGLPF